MRKPEDRTSDYVCASCGVQFLSEEQKKQGGVSTFSISECGLCGEKTHTTHIRRYNYLNKKEDDNT